jgi:DNA transposition AAA+ family ATPase
MINEEIKQEILKALEQKRSLFEGSDSKFALSIGINSAQYSRLKNGDTERVVSNQVWVSLARQLDVKIGNAMEWLTALTPAFEYISTQLNLCKTMSASRLLCDAPDIGKTHTARHFAKNNKNVIYVDCSQVKTKNKLIKFIAKEFGVGYTGRYADIYADLVYYLKGLEMPLIILDEAGDLEYNAFLELKALWNATEGTCGWYMMGADGLKRKIDTRIEHRKVGYTEVFSRFGGKYMKVSPDNNEDFKEFKIANSALIIKANFPEGVNIKQVVVQADFSLRNLKEVKKKLIA